MKKGVILLSLFVFVVSFLPAYLSGISTPDIARAGTDGLPADSSSNEYIPAISPQANLIRNLWGAPKDERVDLVFSRSENTVGWSWKRDNPVRRPGMDYILPIYPNARITLDSPVTVGDIESFKLFAGYNYVEKPSGMYNVALDIFLRIPGTNKVKAEIMVALYTTDKPPLRYLKGIRTDNINIYRYYSWIKSDGSTFHSFLLSNPSDQMLLQLDFKSLISLVKAEKTYNIYEVELGTEVWSGSGALELTTYYLELNNTRL